MEKEALWAVVWPTNKPMRVKRTTRTFVNEGRLEEAELTKTLTEGEAVPEAPLVPLVPPAPSDGATVTTAVPVPAAGDTNKDCEPAAGDPVPLGPAEYPDAPAEGDLVELELGGLAFIKGP